MAEQGTFVWNHLVTPDQKASGVFFSELLGWTREEIEVGPLGVYTVFQNHGQDAADMMNPSIDYTRQCGAWIPRRGRCVRTALVDEPYKT